MERLIEENRSLHANLRMAAGDCMQLLELRRERLVCVDCFAAGVGGEVSHATSCLLFAES